MDYRVIVIAFNRPIHTQRVIESLQKEGVKSFTVFIDGTMDEDVQKKQAEIIQYLSTIDWADFEIVHRKVDLGLAKSIVLSVSDTLRTYDSVVVLEDDCIVRPGFVKYFETALNEYERDQSVGAICGYSYPIIQMDPDKPDYFLASRFTPWGWATWKNRWQNYTISLTSLRDQAKSKQINISDFGEDLMLYLEDSTYLSHKQEIWSLNWILTLIINRQLVLYPKISLIDNIGFDGTGVHSEATKVFDNNSLGVHETDIKKLTSAEYDDATNLIIKKFLESNSKKTMVFKNEKSDGENS
ncbi:MAG: hypothetical protein HQ506_02175 [Candidatus Marinimicrobia bacterium]|nr:hypothetical protein [Candidatus Neomarinimicrobiota bacterium]